MINIPNQKDSLIIRRKAITELSGETDYGDNFGGITRWGGDPEKQPTEEQIQNKIQEYQDAQPNWLLREERNKRLAETDWWAMGDRMDSMTNDQKIYRKTLRDLPTTATPKLDEDGNLTNVTWPTEPE